jgi:hypothetical protein
MRAAFFILSISIFCAAGLAAKIHSYSLQPLPVGGLKTIMGATSCYYKAHAVCNKRDLCQELEPGSSIYFKREPTGVDQYFCIEVTSGSGYTQCQNDTYGDCYYIYSCSDSHCNNCNDSTERTVTSVKFSGDPCSVGG